jgi:hypothetical protein
VFILFLSKIYYFIQRILVSSISFLRKSPLDGTFIALLSNFCFLSSCWSSFSVSLRRFVACDGLIDSGLLDFFRSASFDEFVDSVSL